MDNVIKILELLKTFCELQVKALPDDQGCKTCPNALTCDFEVWEAAQRELDEAEIKVEIY
jgi:hypothetical protein